MDDATTASRAADEALERGDTTQAERLYRQAIKLEPDNPRHAATLAGFFRRNHRKPDAERLLHKAIKAHPDDPALLREMGELHTASRRFAKAIELLMRVIEMEPDSPEAHLALGRARLKAMDPVGAIESLTRACELDPDDAEINETLGRAHHNNGWTHRAIPFYERALEHRPDSIELLVNLGEVCRIEGRFDEALAMYDRALAQRPNLAPAIAGQAEIRETLGQHEQASAMIDEALRSSAPDPTVVLTAARIARRRRSHEDAIMHVRRALATPGLTPEVACRLLFELGSLLEATGACDEAFACYERGNAHLRQPWFTEEGYTAFIDSMIDAFDADRMPRLPRAENQSELPLFIVGMPRSGTSLVEQMLASHPGVVGAGELNDIGDTAGRLPAMLGMDTPYPACAASLTTPALDQLADRYVTHLRELGPDATRVTDKMPHNFTHLGLISLMLPRARVIHCIRNPLDTCVSCFATPLPAVHAYATDLALLASAYRQYRRLMDHWKAVIDLPILDVAYEELVDDPEGQCRRLIAFAGLDWDDRCLRFHESDRVTRTASLDQVRRPIYRSSIGRHTRFETHIGPLRQALADLIEVDAD
jgi:tetratricopeptide (TPR) repeat protein